MARPSKTIPTISRQQFRDHAKPLPVTINGKELIAGSKEFSTGSLGWYLNDKLQVEIDGKIVVVQVGLNLTIVGSKEIPDDAISSARAASEAAASPPPARKAVPVPPRPTTPEDPNGQADF